MREPQFKISISSIINVVGAAIILYLLVVLTSTIKHNYDLGRQVNDLNAQVTQAQDQKNQLSDAIAYYNTDAFRDREARAKLGLQLPGENVIIIPHPSASPTPALSAPTKTFGTKSNFQQWLDFLTGRG